MSNGSETKSEKAIIDRLEARPVRVIPFDLGCQVTQQKTAEISSYLKNNHQPIELSGRVSSILIELCAAFSIKPNVVDCYVFLNGICVCVVFDEQIDICENKEYFSIDYCANRKAAHESIFEWRHSSSQAIRQTIEALRNIVHNNKSNIRSSGLDTFENKGMSYVMTLSMFQCEEDQIYDWDYLPDWLQNNITCLLDPEILFLEDSKYFVHSSGNNRKSQERIIDSLQPEEQTDYEIRKHISTFISWSSVLVFGKLSQCDADEYIALEIELQKNWYYLYCIEKTLKSGAETSQKVEIAELRELKCRLELFCDRLHQFEDTSVPTRLLRIQDGLLETSGILINLQRVQRKLDCLIETVLYENQIKQNKFNQSSEILLFVIAYIQIVPIVHKFFREHIGETCSILSLLSVAIIGAIVLILKDK